MLKNESRCTMYYAYIDLRKKRPSFFETNYYEVAKANQIMFLLGSFSLDALKASHLTVYCLAPVTLQSIDTGFPSGIMYRSFNLCFSIWGIPGPNIIVIIK